MDLFPDGGFVRLRNRVRHKYVHADEDALGVSLRPLGLDPSLRSVPSLNVAWKVHRILHDDDDSTTYVLLQGAAYGRYLAVSNEEDGHAPPGQRGVLAVQRDYTSTNPKDPAFIWTPVRVEAGQNCILLHKNDRCLRANGRHRYRNKAVTVDVRNGDETTMIQWRVEVIPSTPEPLPLPPPPQPPTHVRRGLFSREPLPLPPPPQPQIHVRRGLFIREPLPLLPPPQPPFSDPKGKMVVTETQRAQLTSPPKLSGGPVPLPTSSSAPSWSSPPHAAPSSEGRGTPPRSPPCAACSYQRRWCSPNCLLRPYFVADEPHKFRNALRLFGVKNLERILRAVPPPRQDACVRTIVYESNVRAADPVRGCSGIIQDLENQLMDTAVELEVLRRRLESYRQMTRGRGSQPPNPLPIQQQLMMARTGDDGVQTQGPYGVPPAAAANEVTTTQPQVSSATEMEPRSSQVQPQLSTMRRP